MPTDTWKVSLKVPVFVTYQLNNADTLYEQPVLVKVIENIQKYTTKCVNAADI